MSASVTQAASLRRFANLAVYHQPSAKASITGSTGQAPASAIWTPAATRRSCVGGWGAIRPTRSAGDDPSAIAAADLAGPAPGIRMLNADNGQSIRTA